MALENIIKNKFKEVYTIYDVFTSKVKELVDSTKSIETEIVLLDVQERKEDTHSEEKKNLVRELFVNMYEIQMLQMDMARISNELIGYYKILLTAGISLDLTPEQVEGLNLLTENVGTFLFAVDKGKVIYKQPEMKDIVLSRIRNRDEQDVLTYINSMRENPMYNKIIADNTKKS